MSATTIHLKIMTPSGISRTFPFPAHFEVCGTCRGKGSRVNPAIDGHGLSSEDFAEDPDFADAYFSGEYDVTCDECGGERVVPVVDVDELRGIKRARYALFERQDDEIRETYRLEAMERRRGA